MTEFTVLDDLLDVDKRLLQVILVHFRQFLA
jgi:hypothetical protein